LSYTRLPEVAAPPHERRLARLLRRRSPASPPDSFAALQTWSPSRAPARSRPRVPHSSRACAR